jgi:transposase-like protein
MDAGEAGKGRAAGAKGCDAAAVGRRRVARDGRIWVNGGERLMTEGEIVVAEGDEEKRKALSEKQQQAIELLVTGKTVSEAAREIGVARETVSRWANGNAEFMAALNRLRRDLHKSHTDRMRQLATRAYETLEELLGGEAPPYIRLKAALAVIEAAKGVEGEVGFTSAKLFEIERQLDWAVTTVDALELEALMKRRAVRNLKAIEQLDKQRKEG